MGKIISEDATDQITVENSKKLLGKIFLDCPQCGSTGYINRFETNAHAITGFYVKCKCSEWLHEFKTREV